MVVHSTPVCSSQSLFGCSGVGPPFKKGSGVVGNCQGDCMAASVMLLYAACALAAALLVARVRENSSEQAGKAVLGSGEMFDAIAPRYDVINTALSLGMHSLWRRKMVSSLELKPGMQLLCDVSFNFVWCSLSRAQGRKMF